FFKGYKEYDGYKGYIRSNDIRIFKERPTHKIVVGKCNVYKKPSEKFKLKIEFFLNSRIRIKKSKNNFYQFDKFWIKKNNIKPIQFQEKKFINVTKKFLGTKYLWGGNTKKGIDCSALVQESLKTMNIYCPRDSRDQRVFFKKDINIKNIRSGDLLF
ncbi:MAG: C40 family peptidase, partial [Candidatus Fonsibacter sp.]